MKNVIVESLSSPGCHNCKLFEEFWYSIATEFPNVEYKKIDLLSSEGMKMAQKYSILASPGIVINGELFSVGGVPKDEFIKKLKTLNI